MGRARGQTNIDFIIGIVVFLLAFSFVLGSMPQLFAPYENEATPLVAERVEATLTDALLTLNDSEPGVLNETCTIAFFTGSQSCSTFDSSDSLVEQVGIGAEYSVNASLRRNVSGDGTREIICHNNPGFGDCAGGGDRLTVGPTIPQGDRSVAAQRRTVELDGNATVLEVRVW